MKKVHVFTDDPTAPDIVLTISANVVAEVITSPNRIAIQSTPQGEKTVVKTFTVQNLSPQPLTVKEIGFRDQRVKVEPAKKIDLPAVIKPKEALEFIVTIDTSNTALGNMLRDEITVVTDNPHTPNVPITLSARFGPAPPFGLPPQPSPLPLPR